MSSEQMDSSTLEMVSAGLHWSFRMSRQMPPLLQKHTAPNSFSQLWMRSSQASTRVARMSTMPPSRHTTNWIPAHTAQPTTDTTDNHSRHVTPRPAAPPPSTPPCCTC